MCPAANLAESATPPSRGHPQQPGPVHRAGEADYSGSVTPRARIRAIHRRSTTGSRQRLLTR